MPHQRTPPCRRHQVVELLVHSAVERGEDPQARLRGGAKGDGATGLGGGPQHQRAAGRRCQAGEGEFPHAALSGENGKEQTL